MRTIRVFEAIIWVRKKMLRTSNIHNQAAWSAFIAPNPFSNFLQVLHLAEGISQGIQLFAVALQYLDVTGDSGDSGDLW